jgi:hypothetical protein
MRKFRDRARFIPLHQECWIRLFHSLRLHPSFISSDVLVLVEEAAIGSFTPYLLSTDDAAVQGAHLELILVLPRVCRLGLCHGVRYIILEY